MTPKELKNNIFSLIDNIENETFLSNLHEIILKYKNASDAPLWQRLSEEEQQELLLSEKESDDDNNLVSQSEILKKHRKWL